MQTIDTYRIFSQTDVNTIDQHVLCQLYQPIIGSISIGLYLTMCSELKLDRLLSVESTFYRLSLITHRDLEQIEQALSKLSAIGLIKMMIKSTQVTEYLIELIPPKTPHDFYEHPLLVASLHRYLGKLEYEKTKFMFLKPVINTDGFEVLPHAFDQFIGVEFSVEDTNAYVDTKPVLNHQTVNPHIGIDLELLKLQLKSYQLSDQLLTKQVLECLSQIQAMYQLTTLELSSLLMQSHQEHGFDLKQLEQLSSVYYEKQLQPKKLEYIYHHQPIKQHSRHINNPTIERMDSLNCFDYLRYLLGKKPNRSDLMIVEGLILRFDLNPGVVNVILDYTIQKEGRLVKRYVEAIASTMKTRQIETVEAAMIEIKKASKKTKTNTKKKTTISYDKEVVDESDSFDDLLQMMKEEDNGTY